MNEGYLDRQAALAFLQTCRQSGTVVLGVDRFVRTGGRLLADIGGIADFSTGPEPLDSGTRIKAAEKFIASFEREAGECFEIVVPD